MSSYRFECSRKRKGLTFQLLKSIVDIPRPLQSATVFRIRSVDRDVKRKLLDDAVGTIFMPEADWVFINLPINGIHILCFFHARVKRLKQFI